MKPPKNEIVAYLKSLQRQITEAFSAFEPHAKFNFTPWDYKEKGGGIIGSLRGEVFEKAAVNFSAISGLALPFSLDNSEPFFATGVSLITHMTNPHAPTVHMNVRYIETKDRFWLGGGYDLTPMGFFYEEDKEHFHRVAKEALDPINKNLYPAFSEQAKEYFYIPHRGKERGVGGLFFDQYHTDNEQEDFTMWKAVAESFLQAILPIYKRRVNIPFNSEDRKRQSVLRGHYVEFNLIYDRGTKFGFLSGGNPEAILSSMPPLASW